jgi:hypothetical protein
VSFLTFLKFFTYEATGIQRLVFVFGDPFPPSEFLFLSLSDFPISLYHLKAFFFKFFGVLIRHTRRTPNTAERKDYDQKDPSKPERCSHFQQTEQLSTRSSGQRCGAARGASCIAAAATTHGWLSRKQYLPI